MELRSLPGGRGEVSVLGLSLDSPHASIHPEGPAAHRLLRSAQASGVRLIDTADSIHPARTEASVVRAPAFHPGTVWLIGRSAAGLGLDVSRPPRRGEDAPVDLPLRESIPPLGERSELNRWVEWRETPAHPEWDSAALATLRALEQEGTIGGWVLRTTNPIPREDETDDRLLSDDGSLLDRRWEATLTTGPLRAWFLARNPMAAGRLDGSRWSRTLNAEAGPGGPTPLRRLQEEVAPVLAFGFLTEGRQRTLAQSALQYLAGAPGVASVLAPLPAPERLDELLRFEETPAVTVEERERIARLPDPGSMASPPMYSGRRLGGGGGAPR